MIPPIQNIQPIYLRVPYFKTTHLLSSIHWPLCALLILAEYLTSAGESKHRIQSLLLWCMVVKEIQNTSQAAETVFPVLV